ncbi:MAG: metallophosphoesterase [Oscillospiraceae bacterium]|nr:metallophosphoesterase [Oscillospiraceae bacterium]
MKLKGWLRKHKKPVIAVFLFLLTVIFLYDGNNRLDITEYDYTGSDVPQSFEGYRIVQISDLHNKVFPNENAGLMEEIRALKPDLILLTGDIVDGNTHTDYDAALLFMQQIPKIAPVYYVFGNHEYQLRLSMRTAFVEQSQKWGVQYLDNENVQIRSDAGETFTLIGLNDHSLRTSDLQKLVDRAEDDFQIVMAHEPEYLWSYADTGADLVFSGHEHGGQIRIPFTHQGLFAPDEGLFPRYSEGMFTQDDTTLIISRGLGNSRFPFRIFNHPEIVAVTLHAA